MAYATLAELKLYLNIGSSTDDVLLSSLITRAQGVIDTYTKRTFEASADTTRYFHAIDDVTDYTLHLDHDLYSVTTVTNGDGTVVSASNYVLLPANYRPAYAIALKWSSSVVWTYSTSPENAISITGRWAYSLTAPSDIQQACIRLAAWFYRQKDTHSDVDNSTIATGGMVLVPQGVPKDVHALLKGYIR